MAVPAAATDIIWPDWANSVDNWREQDAEWLRNRTVQIFTNSGNRSSVMGTVPQFGVMSILQAPDANTPGGTEFWNGTSWESVRYPNLQVTSDATSVTLKRYTAGAGIQLGSDGAVNITTLDIGTGKIASGGTGIHGDNTGLSLKIGVKTVKLSTDGTQLTVDSPVSIAGGLTAAAATLASLNVSGTTNLTGALTAAGVNAAAVTATGTVQGATVQAGTTQMTGNQVKANAGAAAVTLATDGTLSLAATSLNLGGASTAVVIPGTVTAQKAVTFNVIPVVSASGKDANVQAAMIQMQSGTAAPTTNPPDGTLFVTY